MSQAAANPAVPAASHHRHAGLVNGALALSLANLCFVRAWFSLLADADYGYFNKLPVTAATLAGLALNLLGATVVFWLAATVLQRCRAAWPRRLGLLTVVALLLIPANFTRLNYFSVTGTTMLAVVGHPLCLPLGVLAAAAVWHWHRWLAYGVRALLLILLPLGVLTWVRILLVLLHVNPLRQYEGPPVLAPPLAAAKTQPRVVWLVFDEWDYRLTFAQRPAGLVLPEFDRLRAESLFATNALPPANNTLASMPALTTGQRVASAAPCAPTELRLVLADTNRSANWSELPNVFGRARALGFNSAVVGWYHPYRRIFSNSLSYCSWYPLPLPEPSRGRTLGEAMVNQLWSTVMPMQSRRLEVKLYQASLTDALAVVTNRHYGLSLLHLPGPHKPGIYRPQDRSLTMWHFSTVQGYFDNLALTDVTLGRLRRQMEAAGVWDQTWLIVSTDHAWREDNLYDGKHDLRVPFLVKAPGRNEGLEIGERFNTLTTSELILAILREEVRSPAAARDWLLRNRVDLPPTEGSFTKD